MQIQEKVKIISSLTQVDEPKVKQILMLNMLMQKNIDDSIYANIKALIGTDADVTQENTCMQDATELYCCIDSANDSDESMSTATADEDEADEDEADEDEADEDAADVEMYCILGEVTTG